MNRIRKRLPANTSLIEEIAEALDISYDAAHRRTSLKSKLSLEESMQLARRFHISLDGLHDVSSQDIVAVQKTASIRSEEDLQKYFERSYISLSSLKASEESHLLYSAKDIPLFYLLEGNLLTRFKCYVWLKLLDPTFSNKKFSHYHPSLPLLTAAKELGGIYGDLTISEIWDVTTVNSTLKQIHFYFEAGLLEIEDALVLCSQIEELITNLSQKVSKSRHGFQLYYNELLLMNNQVLVQTKSQQSLYVPFSMLSYYLTSDSSMCEQANDYFQKQLEHSKLLNTAGEKEQNTFFNKMYSKIEALKQLLSAYQVLDFE
ncbi:hypothetical protein POV27_04195 [Aureisphaera galaxeae]|uniref:hypothetical protein n=1 Tax=Aureisphaera galaxeae TaxID=1538023 RepID=UPI00234FB670|nr:hypothetical protein [Aureisphaera galaxeae]MDC8003236.1 hypothetical protein [Aureisphaera galaxeae]